MLSTIKTKFQDLGVKPVDTIDAILYYKVLAHITGIATLAVCYRYRPLVAFTNTPLIKPYMTSLKNINIERYTRWKNYVVTKTEMVAESRFFKPIPNMIGVDSRRFTMALAENFVFYKLMYPIFLPLQFWLISQHFKNKYKKHV